MCQALMLCPWTYTLSQLNVRLDADIDAGVAAAGTGSASQLPAAADASARHARIRRPREQLIEK